MSWWVDRLCIVLRLAQKYYIYIWICHHCKWRTAKLWSFLSAFDLRTHGGLYRATLALTKSLGFCDLILIMRTAPCSRLVRQARAFFKTQILMQGKIVNGQTWNMLCFVYSEICVFLKPYIYLYRIWIHRRQAYLERISKFAGP